MGKMDENRVTYGENESKWGFFLLENKKTIYRAFERIGISLKTDGSEDSASFSHREYEPVCSSVW